MKNKTLAVLAAGTLALASLSASAEALRVAATAVPHAEILEFVKPRLAAEGVELEIKVFTDYVQPNVQVMEKRLDANFFQHKLYLDEFNKFHAGRGEALVPVVAVHVEPFGAYSRTIKTLEDLPEGATVAIPNDPSNGGRALLLLVRQGLITLKNPGDHLAAPKDIAANPKRLRFKELEAAALPRVLDQVELVLINTNYALEARLVPTRDALFIEGAGSPYANILVARADNADAPAIKKLAAALVTPEVRDFLANKYQGAIVPAF